MYDTRKLYLTAGEGKKIKNLLGASSRGSSGGVIVVDELVGAEWTRERLQSRPMSPAPITQAEKNRFFFFGASRPPTINGPWLWSRAIGMVISSTRGFLPGSFYLSRYVGRIDFCFLNARWKPSPTRFRMQHHRKVRRWQG